MRAALEDWLTISRTIVQFDFVGSFSFSFFFSCFSFFFFFFSFLFFTLFLTLFFPLHCFALHFFFLFFFFLASTPEDEWKEFMEEKRPLLSKTYMGALALLHG